VVKGGLEKKNMINIYQIWIQL